MRAEASILPAALPVALIGYDYNAPQTLDVCQGFVFAPGNSPDYFGSFTLLVLRAAGLSLGLRALRPARRAAL